MGILSEKAVDVNTWKVVSIKKIYSKYMLKYILKKWIDIRRKINFFKKSACCLCGKEARTFFINETVYIKEKDEYKEADKSYSNKNICDDCLDDIAIDILKRTGNIKDGLTDEIIKRVIDLPYQHYEINEKDFPKYKKEEVDKINNLLYPKDNVQ